AWRRSPPLPRRYGTSLVGRGVSGASGAGAEGREDVGLGRQALNVLAMPKRIEQQRPGGKAGASPIRLAEQLLDRFGQANLADAGLTRHQLAQLRAASRDPFADRDGEAALARERLGRGHMLGEPAAQQPLAEVAADLELVRQAKREIGDDRVEEWRPS